MRVSFAPVGSYWRMNGLISDIAKPTPLNPLRTPGAEETAHPNRVTLIIGIMVLFIYPAHVNRHAPPSGLRSMGSSRRNRGKAMGRAWLRLRLPPTAGMVSLALCATFLPALPAHTLLVEPQDHVQK